MHGEVRPVSTWTFRASATLWLRWVLANVLGGIVAYLLATFLGALFGGLDALAAAFTGVVIGFAQWQVIRDYVPGTRLLGWLVLTTVSFGLSLPVFQSMGQIMALLAGQVAAWDRYSALYGAVPATLGLVDNFAFPMAIMAAAATGAFSGLITGTLQSLSLRLRLRASRLWIPACAVGGMLGTLMGLWAALVEGANLTGVALTPTRALIIGAFFSPWGIFVGSSLVTGLAFVWMVKRHAVEAEKNAAV